MEKDHGQRGHRQAGTGTFHLLLSLIVILVLGMMLCISCGKTFSAFGAETKEGRGQGRETESAQNKETESGQDKEAESAQSKETESGQDKEAESAQSKETESAQRKETETEGLSEWMLETIAGLGKDTVESMLPEDMRQLVESMTIEEMAEYLEIASKVFHNPDFQSLIQYEEVRDFIVTLLHDGLIFAAEDPIVTDKILVTMGADRRVISVLFYLLEKRNENPEILDRLREVATSKEANELIDLLIGMPQKENVNSAGIEPETELEKTRQSAYLKQADKQNARESESEDLNRESKGEDLNRESEIENPVAEAIYRFGDRLQESFEEVSRLEREEAAQKEKELLERRKTMEKLNRNIGTYLTLTNMITDGTPWLIRVNQTTCVVTVYRVLTLETGSRQSYGLLTKQNLAELAAQRIIDTADETESQTVTVYVPVYACPCSVGSPGHETPTGTFYIQDHLRWHELVGPTWGQWCCHFAPSYLFHSLPYERPNDPGSLQEDAYNMIGQPASHGCVRLAAVDAKYIFDHVPTGGQIEIFYGTAEDDLFGKPERPFVGEWTRGYDPTDPEYMPEPES